MVSLHSFESNTRTLNKEKHKEHSINKQYYFKRDEYNYKKVKLQCLFSEINLSTFTHVLYFLRYL